MNTSMSDGEVSELACLIRKRMNFRLIQAGTCETCRRSFDIGAGYLMCSYARDLLGVNIHVSKNALCDLYEAKEKP